MDKEPRIIIAGFGRSGTTWLSDIISKCLGGLILFEPFHPEVCPIAKETAYAPTLSKKGKTHINEILTQPISNPWLLRNTLVEPIQETHQSTIDYLQQHTSVIGYKTVRGIHCMSDLVTEGDKGLYIYRNPYAVIASIKKRKNFWKEFGWDWHRSNFFSRALTSKHLNKKQITSLLKILEACDHPDEIMALMWTISFLIGHAEAAAIGAHHICYEKLYLNPFEETRSLLSFLGKDDINVHPSYLFTPSMTTMKTVHLKVNRKEMENQFLDRLFLNNKEGFKKQKRIVEKGLSLHPELGQKAIKERYL